jgi:3'-5' exoribonuclease
LVKRRGEAIPSAFSFIGLQATVTRLKPNLVRLRELALGQSGDFFALLAERTRGTTREGKAYFACRFRDTLRLATYMVWQDGRWFDNCEREWKDGQFFKLRGTYTEHERYGPQLEVELIRPATDSDREDGFDPADLVVRSRFDPEAMLNELRSVAEKNIANDSLRRLTLTLLERHAEPLKRLPATQRHFYPFPGGLLEHLLSVTLISLNLADTFAARYTELHPPLNRDLVVAAAILHDLGRVGEISDETLSPQPTVPGRALGHLVLGRDMVRDAAREQGDVDPELLLLLEHVLLSHLALPEWGSPRLPLVPECLIVHHADDLDAKMEMYVRCLSRDKEEGPFTARDPVLGKQLLKRSNF